MPSRGARGSWCARRPRALGRSRQKDDRAPTATQAARHETRRKQQRFRTQIAPMVMVMVIVMITLMMMMTMIFVRIAIGVGVRRC